MRKLAMSPMHRRPYKMYSEGLNTIIAVYRSRFPPNQCADHELNLLYQLLMDELPSGVTVIDWWENYELKHSTDTFTRQLCFRLHVTDRVEWMAPGAMFTPRMRDNILTKDTRSATTQTPKPKVRKNTTQTSKKIQTKKQGLTKTDVTTITGEKCHQPTSQSKVEQRHQPTERPTTRSKVQQQHQSTERVTQPKTPAPGEARVGRMRYIVCRAVKAAYDRIALPAHITDRNWTKYSRFRVENTFPTTLKNEWFYWRRMKQQEARRKDAEPLWTERNDLLRELSEMITVREEAVRRSPFRYAHTRTGVNDKTIQDLTNQVLELNSKIGKQRLV